VFNDVVSISGQTPLLYEDITLNYRGKLIGNHVQERFHVINIIIPTFSRKDRGEIVLLLLLLLDIIIVIIIIITVILTLVDKNSSAII
jgi:hypothetical protein